MERFRTLGDMTVADVRHLIVEDPTVVAADATTDDLLEAIVRDTRTRHTYVVDEEGVLIGAVRMNAIVGYLFPIVAMTTPNVDLSAERLSVFSARAVTEIMNDQPRAVTESTSLADVARVLLEEHINELPVVDETGRLIGQVNVYEIIATYLKGSKGA